MNHRMLGFCIGIGVGVGIGLLFAPKSGKATRALILDKVEEGAEYIKDAGARIRHQASEFTHRGAEAIGRQKEGIRAAMRASKRAYSAAVHA